MDYIPIHCCCESAVAVENMQPAICEFCGASVRVDILENGQIRPVVYNVDDDYPYRNNPPRFFDYWANSDEEIS